MAGENNSIEDTKALFEQYKHVHLKLKLDGVQGSPTRKIRIEKLNELSYEALKQEAIRSSREVEDPSPGESNDLFKATIKYEDVDRDQILIASTEELIAAVQESGHKGFLYMTVLVEPKQRSVVTPPQVPASVACRPHVASMYLPAVAAQLGSTRRYKRLEFEDSDNEETVSFNAEENYSAVAVKQEEDIKEEAEEDTKEPPKKRRRHGPKVNEHGDTVTVSDKICYGLAELRALGLSEPLRTQVSHTAGYSNARSPGFSKQLGYLKKHGMIEYRSGSRLALTAQGWQQFKVEPPQDNADAQTRLLKILDLSSKSGKKGVQGTKVEQVFGLLNDGKVHEKEKVAAALGYKNLRSPGFSKVLSTMGGLELVHYPRGNKPSVQLTDIAFPFGRPV